MFGIVWSFSVDSAAHVVDRSSITIRGVSQDSHQIRPTQQESIRVDQLSSTFLKIVVWLQETNNQPRATVSLLCI